MGDHECKDQGGTTGPHAREEKTSRESRLTSVLRAVRNVNQLIVHEDDPQRLIERACGNMTETLGYHNAWIVLLDGDRWTVAATAIAGGGGPFDALRQRLVRGEFSPCMRQALEKDATVVVNDPSVACADCPLAREYGGRAGFARRLAFEGRIYGILAVSMPAAFVHDSEEQSLFDEMAGELGFALHKIELRVRLGQNEERLRLALKATNDVVWDWDIVHDAQRWNESGAAVFGWKDIVEAPQTSAWWVDRIHPEDRPRVDQTFFAAVRDPAADRWRDEYRFRKADGSYACVVDRGHILRDADGRAVRVIGAMLDVTERRRAEQSLKESEARFATLFRSSPMAAAITEVEDGRMVDVNAEFERISGYARGDCLGRPVRDMGLWVQPGERAELVRKVREEGAAHGFECRLRRASGETLPVLMSAEVVRIGDADFMLTMALDISQRKQAEEALHREHQWLQFVVDGSRLGTWVWNVQTNETVFNETWAGMLGYTLSELTPYKSETWERLLHPDDIAGAMERLRRCADGETQEYECEFRMRHKDGHWVWILDRGRVMTHDASGAPLSMFGTHTDITQIKDREARMAILVRMLDDAPAAITIHDTNGRFLFSNRQSILLHGYDSEEEFLSVNLHALDLPESEVLLAERFRQITERGEARFEVAHRRKDGSTFPLDVTARAIEWRGQPAVLSIAMDVTERKRAEEEREKLQSQFLQAQKMESIGRLAGGVAHDFNNLLMGIMNYTELCRDKVAPDHPIREWLDEITAEAQRSANLVRQLLAFARKQVVQPKALDLNEQIGGMLKMLRRLIGERIDLTWSPAAALRLVNADPSHIDQVMANLCVNAADAIAGNGRIAIATRKAAMDDAACVGLPGMAPGEYVLVTVADTGCGMDVDTQTHVFEPFFTTKGVGCGTGLGLATVYGIVKQSGGFVYVDSVPGAGTTFSIYLPALECPATEAAPLAEAGSPSGGNETILVVDDERSIRVTMAAYLERLGYTVLMADGPETALRLAREHVGALDLLLSDMVMPGMSGVELRDRLLPDHPGLKTMLITGYTTAEFVEPEGRGTDTVCLTKPVPLRDLAMAIRSVLSDQRGETT